MNGSRQPLARPNFLFLHSVFLQTHRDTRQKINRHLHRGRFIFAAADFFWELTRSPHQTALTRTQSRPPCLCLAGWYGRRYGHPVPDVASFDKLRGAAFSESIFLLTFRSSNTDRLESQTASSGASGLRTCCVHPESFLRYCCRQATSCRKRSRPGSERFPTAPIARHSCC